MREQMVNDSAATVREVSVHCVRELTRARAEIDGVIRLLRAAHVAAGSTPAKFRNGETWEDLTIAGDAVDAAAVRICDFLHAQVVALRSPIEALDDLYTVDGVDRRDLY